MQKINELITEIREYIARQYGQFTLRDLYNELGLIGKIDKRNASTYMLELVDEGVIERHPERSGTYRVVLHSLESINYKGAPERLFPIVWPLGIEKLARLHPKTIAVVAGEPESGKTALLLNVIYLNNEEYANRIALFSSEMGNDELRGRLELFQKDINWWNFRAYERSSNFADVVEPNSINIIDYLEISDSFYQVASQMMAIRNKLENGIAIVAIQKSADSKYGRGGTFGAEKARIYVSLEALSSVVTELTIVKAKNRASVINPVGLKRRFAISGGAIIKPITDEWTREGIPSNA